VRFSAKDIPDGLGRSVRRCLDLVTIVKAHVRKRNSLVGVNCDGCSVRNCCSKDS
jgi:hypothetical protein